MVEKIKTIRSEEELSNWFIDNYKKLGYTKIVKINKKSFPDFVMLKNNKTFLVELETQASHFILHNHDEKKVDEVVCVEKDISLRVPTIKVKGLKYLPRLTRLSATVDKETVIKINKLVESGRYRNKSHVVESAIEFLEEKDDK